MRMQGSTQAKISDQPCETPAAGGPWNDDSVGLTDPVNPCSPGITLEPASVSPRHGCNIHLDRPSGLGAETAHLGIEVVAQCTSKIPRPCSLLGSGYSPSAQHPVTAIVYMTYPALFQADTENTPDTATPENTPDTATPENTPGTATPEETPDTGEKQDPPTENFPTEDSSPQGIPTESET
ncbi:hypothetical protein [Streptosporangium longisporum]|uniref:hypothetical protein n=1 Tax=Streptosporangium longisporum TaxID=46187 RepID=UPI0031EAF66E